MAHLRWLLCILVVAGCASSVGDETPDSETGSPTPGQSAAPPRATESGATRSPAGSPGGEAEQGPASFQDTGAVARGRANVRIMAANISSGEASTYDSGEGIRIFRGLHPDIALIQELNYKGNTDDDLAELVKNAFGEGYALYREPDVQIPNGIASRYPIVESGRWADPNVDNRGFAYAKIGVPGPHPLWAVSVHLLTTGASNRNAEARNLVGMLKTVIAPDDYVAVGGDFNTDGRTESCLGTFAELLDTRAPYPADQSGNEKTNRSRGKPYDWVLVSPMLRAHQVATVIGTTELGGGLVFDSRVYMPLSDVAPVLRSDSEAINMQHMPVVKDFLLSE